ncbi:uncharacterized protein LOC134286520 [Aedes albopictus]|uniref:Reverse transcriptase Ty1/copia-type domain-containing protein n=1 Tax=Aedes albopictus TaxID=7160 RepID=A0ABM1YEL8_AEDAL
MSRPDLCYSVNVLSKFQSSPQDIHWTGLKRILRYLQGTKDLRLVYKRQHHEAPLERFADADFANDEDERRSISGSLFTVYGDLVSWSTKKQAMGTLSSTEAELISLCGAAKEGVWLSNLLCEVGIKWIPFTMNEDNMPCIRIAEEPRSHQPTYGDYRAKMMVWHAGGASSNSLQRCRGVHFLWTGPNLREMARRQISVEHSTFRRTPSPTGPE